MDLPETESIVLERLRVQARSQLSPQLAHDLEARMFDDVMTAQLGRMILELRSTVYAHRVGVEKISVPFSKRVKQPKTRFRIPSRRRYVIPHALAALFSVLLAAAFASPVVALAAVPFIASGALAWHQGAPYEVSVQRSDVIVEGDVVVEDRLYNTFPDNTTIYPRSLGAPVQLVQSSPPEVFYRHTDDLRGDADR